MSCWCLVLFLKKECKIIRNVAGSQFENRQLVLFSHTCASFSSTCGGCWADLSSQMAQPAELPQDTSMGPSVVKNICVLVHNPECQGPSSFKPRTGRWGALGQPWSQHQAPRWGLGSIMARSGPGLAGVSGWWGGMGRSWSHALLRPCWGLHGALEVISPLFSFSLILWILPGHCLLVKHPNHV